VGNDYGKKREGGDVDRKWENKVGTTEKGTVLSVAQMVEFRAVSDEKENRHKDAGGLLTKEKAGKSIVNYYHRPSDKTYRTVGGVSGGITQGGGSGRKKKRRE